jgi:hypothetical protein
VTLNTVPEHGAWHRPASHRRVQFGLRIWAWQGLWTNRHTFVTVPGTFVTVPGAGQPAEGAVGDASPLLAIGDALRVFDADEILIATHPPGDSNRARFRCRSIIWSWRGTACGGRSPRDR